MNINRTQDFSISLTKVWERHTIKAGFYLNHSYKAQNLGAGGGASFQGNISFANDTGEPARLRLRLRQRRPRRVHQLSAAVEVRRGQLHLQPGGLVRPGQLEGQLQADARLRPALRQPAAAVRPVPAVVELLPGALVAGRGAGALRARLRRGAVPVRATTVRRAIRRPASCSGRTRPWRSVSSSPTPATRSTASSRPATASRRATTSGRPLATRLASERRTTSPASQRLVLRGGFGLFFDRPNGNSVFSQVGNPPFSTATTVRYSQLQSLHRRADHSGTAVLSSSSSTTRSCRRRTSGTPGCSSRCRGRCRAMCPTSASTASTCCQNVDINAVDFGVGVHVGGAGHDGCRQCDPRRLGAVGRSAAPLPRLRRHSAELGHRLEHVPLDPVVVQPALPQRILAWPELHAGAVEHGQCRESCPARPCVPTAVTRSAPIRRSRTSC